MFIVIESGSTKADWKIVDGERESILSTMGFNPYFHSKQDILLELDKSLELGLLKDKVSHVYFYGAGCSSQKLNNIIVEGFKAFSPMQK